MQNAHRGNILLYFRSSLSFHLSLKSLFCLFLSGRLKQVLLNMYLTLVLYAETPAETPTKQDAASKVISIADQLYSQNEILRLYDYLLEYKDQENDEILWRLARAAVDKGKHSSDDNEKRKLYFEAFDYIKKALVLNEKSSPVHKVNFFYGITL